MEIQQGDVFWVRLDSPDGAEPGIAHPHVVIQADERHPSQTVVVCALTTNLKRAEWPGNVLLAAGEANLPRPSVVEVSKISTIPTAQLGEYTGRLTPQRVRQIQAGMNFLQTLTRRGE